MKRRSHSENNDPFMREKIIGLGERSIRKSYYPQLQQQLEELEQARKQLAASQALYRSLVENISDVIVSLDTNGKATYVSPVIRNMYGLIPEQIVGKEFKRFIHADGRAAFEAALERAMTGKPVTQEQRLEAGSGEFRCTRIAIRSLLEDSRVLGLTCIISDISDRLQAEKALRDSETLLNTSQRLSKVGAWEYNVKTGKAFWTEELYRIHGFPNDPGLDHVKESMACYRAEDRQIITDAFRRACEEGEPYDLELPFTTREGNSLWVRTIAQPVYEDGRVVRVVGNVMDITERKRAEEALRLSTERLQLATRAANIGVWDWDIPRNELLWDDSMYQLYGIQKADFGGAYDAWISAVHPEDKAYTDTEIQAALRGEREYAPEFRIVLPDGTIRYIQADSKTFKDQEGKPVRMIGTNIDITERKETEEALRASEQKFHAIFDQTLQFIGLLSVDGIVLEANHASLQFAGIEADAVLGKSFWDTPWWNHSAEMQQKLRAAVNEAASGKLVRFEANHRAADGSLHCIDFSLKPITDSSGRVIQLIPEGRDITARKQAEQALRTSETRYRNAQTMGHVGNWEYNLQTTYFWGSDEAKRIYGFNPETDTFSTEEVENCILERERVHQALIDLIEKGNEYKLEFEIQPKDGSEPRIIASTAELERDEQGNPLKVLGVIQDITERKQSEEKLRHYKDHLEETVQERTEELRLARDAAEAANKAKSVFLANMSHELRTPLNAILGFSQMMRQDRALDPTQRENLDIINRSGEHLLQLINDVLEIAKIEAGKQQLTIRGFDLHGLVRDVTDMMRLRAEQKGLRLQLDQSAELPRYVRGDEARLRQILVNLVGNAVKFTEEGGVTVRLGIAEGASPRLRVEVEDTGPGISEENRQKLFKPFVQLAEGAAHSGTGLGLAIVSQFVQIMGGTIGMEDAPSGGSLFRVELPLERAEPAEIAASTEVGTGDVVGLLPGQPAYRILIAEDQRDNQILLTRLLAGLGLENRVAGNGIECLRLYQAWRPDLILMDWRMPEMDGVEATRRIRLLPGGDRVKIVAVTASAFKEQQPELLAAGMDDYIRKPYRFNDVYDCLARQLGLQFAYRPETPATETLPTPLTPQHLEGLKEELRAELRDALLSLNHERIVTAIGHIAASDAELARTLSRLTDEFDYPSILNALDTVATGRR